MNRKLIVSGLAAGALAVSGLAATLPGASASPVQSAAPSGATRVCPAHPAPGFASCLAMAVTGAGGAMLQSSTQIAAAFTPADIQKAYNLEGLKSHGRTVAIVDAYAYPTLEADLAVFRKTNGLPPCTTRQPTTSTASANNGGCLTIINQRGGSEPPPTVDPGWDLEQALDLDMVSAACPDCRILMVQSDSNTFKNLGAAVSQAAKTKGVVSISNSYGGGNGPNRADYNHPGIAITASTGDSGYQGGSSPASDTNVIAVGGTSVFKDSSARGFNEKAWVGAGSGCSATNPMPNYQKKAHTTCKTDATADVSGPADPGNGGLSIYYNGRFLQVGGTSESSPMIAAVFALSGRVDGYPGKYLYKNPAHLYDVTSGSNGSCGSPLCDAGAGWDGPTGLGTPNGDKAF